MRIAAAVVAAAVIAAVVVVVVTVPSGSPRPAYTSLPAPCALVSPALVARYLPDPTRTPETVPTAGAVQAGVCRWASTAGGEDRTLFAQVYVFGSASGISAAEQSYNATYSAVSCRCPGVTVSTRSVASLGDQAAAFLVAVSPAATIATAQNAAGPGTSLLVRSSNAEVVLVYDVTDPATGTSLAPDAGPLPGMISMARSILAGLARPAAVAPVPVSAEPHYSGSRDPCQLITATTLARYAPGTSVTPQPQTSGTPGSSSGSLQQCSWGSSNLLVLLTLWSYPNATGAAEDFSTDAQAMSPSTAQVKVTGSQWMSDVGERAVALFQTRPGTGQGVELFVWSGNAKIDLWLNYSGSATPGRIALMTASIAMARDILAALARPAASSQPHGPLYASPSDACALVKASTLAAYAPGAARAPGLGELQGAGGSQTFDCAWSADAGSIDLNLSIYPSADGAQGGFEFDLEQAHQQLDTTIHGTQPVKGLGEQATALFETQMGDSPGVQLYVWSGNAVIQVSFSNVPFSTPVSRAAMLAADTAITRDVLADLHRKAGSAG